MQRSDNGRHSQRSSSRVSRRMHLIRLDAYIRLPVAIDERAIDRSARALDDSSLCRLDEFSRRHMRRKFGCAGRMIPHFELKNFRLAHEGCSIAGADRPTLPSRASCVTVFANFASFEHSSSKEIKRLRLPLSPRNPRKRQWSFPHSRTGPSASIWRRWRCRYWRPPCPIDRCSAVATRSHRRATERARNQREH